jgi:1,4-dihydroxy-2-naphthoate octaprenyltransferase
MTEAPMTESQTPRPQFWLMAARPRTLPAAAAPVFVATALALRDGVFHWPSALACLLISLLMQIGANFANDLFDHERGTDTPDRLGPTRVTAAGLISPRQMRLGTAAIFGLAVLLGREAMRTEYLLCLLGAYLVPLGLWTFGLASVGGLLCWFSIPQAVLLYREFSQAEGRSLNKTLGGTAQLALVYAVLFALGVAVIR